MTTHGDVVVLEAHAKLALRPALAERGDEFLRALLAVEVRHLLRGLLDVAEVGDEAANVATHDRHAVGAGEAGQVAQVDEVRDQQQVEPALLEPLGDAIGTAHSASFERHQRLAVAVGALAADLGHADALEHGHAPELLTRLHVGQMHLHRGQSGDLDGVAERPRVVRPRARVQHEPVGVVGRLVDLLDVLPLVVGLEEACVQAELAREAVDPLLELGEGEPAIVLGRPAVERVEVDAVEHGHPVPHGARNSATARRSSASSTGRPGRTSPGASTSTKPTRPPRRFLSRRVAATTAPGSTALSSEVGSPRAASSAATSARSAAWPDSSSAASMPSPTASPWR